MTKITRTLAAGALALAAALPAAAPAQEVTEINWGLLAVESQDNILKRYEPFLAGLAERTGYKINTFFATDYTGMIEAMRFGKVDVVLYGNKSGMTAVDRAGGEVFAQEAESSGDAGYYSILVTQADNDAINSLEDVLATCGDKSLDFGLGDPQSTSGFLVPMTYVFAANGVTPRDCFKTVLNASHEANLLSAANGQVDVATAHNVALYLRLERNNPEAAKKLKEIWRSPLIASDPLVWRKDLPEDVKARLYYGIMSFGRLGDEETVKAERAALEQVGLGPFNPSSNLQLTPFRILEANRQIMATEADETMTEAERAERIAALREEMAGWRALAEALPQR